tara:strand:+ start:10527 stop:10688 length:162 start_codon:yes stop_codon:yes gene_type:complete
MRRWQARQHARYAYIPVTFLVGYSPALQDTLQKLRRSTSTAWFQSGNRALTLD